MANTITVKDTPIKIGDIVKVYYTYKESGKQKEQIFQGVLISIKGRGENKMFTVRRLSKDKIGVERIFPAISPFIEKVAVVKSGKVRRSKLYFIRGLSEAQLRERIS